MMVTAYNHYVHVPKATRLGDFQHAEKMLFFSERTAGYNGEAVEGVDEIFEANGDFISVIFRVMPHANEPERFAKVVEQIGQISMQTLSEFQGKEPKEAEIIAFPKVGKTDEDVIENNFLEVMQFVFNHSPLMRTRKWTGRSWLPSSHWESHRETTITLKRL